MQLACFPNSYGRFGAEAALDHLPSIGVYWLELPIKNSGTPSFFKEEPLLTDASTRIDVDRVVTQIHAAGMHVCSANISSGNIVDTAVLDRTIRKLQLAKEAGVSRVVAGGGEAHSALETTRLHEHLRRLGDVAAELGITYCCETHPGAFQNATAMLRTLDAIQHPNVRVNFDTGNISFYNEGLDVLEELSAIVEFIGHVHLKDSRGRYQDWYFPALGDGGAIDFRAVLGQLRAAAYDGPVSLEIEGIQGEPEPPLAVYQQRLASSVAHLHRCGW